MRYEMTGRISDTHVDLVESITFGARSPEHFESIPGRYTITVHSGRGSMELPWDAHPVPLVGTPVKFIVEVEETDDERQTDH